MRRTAWLSPALALLVLGLALPARAAVPELTLTWQAPPSCPTEANVAAQFARLLGGASRVPTGKHIDASIVVRNGAAADRWTLELTTTMDGAQGRRSFAGDSCASVSSAAALIMALMIDPAAAERLGAPEEAPPPPAPPPPPTVTAPAAPPPPAPRELAFVARAFAGGVFALLPSPAPAAGVALGARYRWIAAEVTGLATLDHRTTSTAIDAAGGDLQLAALGARACGVIDARAVLLSPCVGAEVEWLSGQGVIERPSAQTATMLAGTAGVLVTLPLARHFALSLDLDAAARAYHPIFSLESAGGTTDLFRIPAVSGFGALGVVVTL